MAKTPKRPRDPNQLAKMVVDLATRVIDDPESDATRIAPKPRGRAGGLAGGLARSNALTPSARSEIARNAAKARWAVRPVRETKEHQ